MSEFTVKFSQEMDDNPVVKILMGVSLTKKIMYEVHSDGINGAYDLVGYMVETPTLYKKRNQDILFYMLFCEDDDQDRLQEISS